MKKLTKDDLAQMNRVYFEKLDQKTLIEAGCLISVYIRWNVLNKIPKTARIRTKIQNLMLPNALPVNNHGAKGFWHSEYNGPIF